MISRYGFVGTSSFVYRPTRTITVTDNRVANMVVSSGGRFFGGNDIYMSWMCYLKHENRNRRRILDQILHLIAVTISYSTSIGALEPKLGANRSSNIFDSQCEFCDSEFMTCRYHYPPKIYRPSSPPYSRAGYRLPVPVASGTGYKNLVLQILKYDG